jgi:uncharacterized membrane protein
MTTAFAMPINPPSKLAERALLLSAQSWFFVACAGQLMFALYILALYGGPAVTGNLVGWNTVMPHGYVAGDGVGNGFVAGHLLAAWLLAVLGLLQLIPQIRQKAPALHRWIGRIFLTAAVTASLSGIVMILTRGTVGDSVQHAGTISNGIVTVLCAGFALRSALARDFRSHRRWAMRLFVVANGVWFFRVMLMCTLLVNQGPFGFDMKTFQGPYLSFLAFAQYLLPLAVLQLYFFAGDQKSGPARVITSFVLGSAAIITAIGVFGATMMMWMPHIVGGAAGIFG